jgi:hypothetical protein
MPGRTPSPIAPTPAPLQAARGRRARAAARAGLALLLAGVLPIPPAAAERERAVVEVPAAACDVCTPGKPPPPPEVQERLRRFNQDVNWRRQPSTGDTIPLGTATRVWLQRAWASGRLQPGVANTSSGAAANRMPAFRGGARAQARTSHAARSRSRLADRRSTRDEGRRGRSRRGSDEASASSSSRSRGGLGGTGSTLGTNRSSSTFGTGGFGMGGEMQ